MTGSQSNEFFIQLYIYITHPTTNTYLSRYKNCLGPLVIRGSSIELTQQAIRNKILYFYLGGGVRIEERRRVDSYTKLALAYSPGHFVRVKSEPKVVHFYSPLLYMIAIC
jgi:hypothetical protein